MNKKKTIIAAIVLALVLVIGGTIAFFTDKDEETNKFVIGDVEIDLIEPNWNADNAKYMIPGDTVNKDPKVENIGKNDAYVYLMVETPCIMTTNDQGAEEPKDLFVFETLDGWTSLGDPIYACETNGLSRRAYSWGDAETLKVLAVAETTDPLFKEVKLNPTLTSTEAEGHTEVEMKVYAYAIQTKNLSETGPLPVWNTYILPEVNNS